MTVDTAAFQGNKAKIDERLWKLAQIAKRAWPDSECRVIFAVLKNFKNLR